MPKLYQRAKGQTRWSSFENTTAKKGAAASENHGAKGHAFDKILPGESITLLDYDEGAGIINRIWITVSDRSQYMLRSLIIRCYWDGAAKPAVEAPLGDFFHAAVNCANLKTSCFPARRANPSTHIYRCLSRNPLK